MKKPMKPIYLFAPITRVDEDQRIVEGHAFVNEVVEGEGGVRLKRTSMEEATPDYMQWGAVRAMHQPIAAGTAQAVEWDDKGAMVRAKIVDDAEWEKVKQGVYKGFSVGVQALVMRGKDVEKCRWIETSLVDRPKDPDARFMVVRAEDATEETEVEVLDEERADKPARQTVYDCGIEYHRHTTEGGATECMDGQEANIQREIDWHERQLADLKTKKRLEDGETEDGTVVLKRFDELDGATEFIARITAVEGDLAKVPALETQLQQAIERIEAVEKRAVPIKPPVRYPEALERTFTQRDGENGNTGNIEELRAEYQALETSLKTEPDEQKRTEGVQRMIGIKNEVSRLARLSQ